MLHPKNFKVNDAWLGIKVSSNDAKVQEGKVNVFVLIDVSSCYVIDQQVVLASEGIMPPIENVESMFMKAFAKAFKYPSKLYIPIEEAESNGFVTVANDKNIPIKYIPASDLDLIVGPIKKHINKALG